MSDRIAITLISLVLIATGGMLLGAPSNSRSGLLFGVYVGEKTSAGSEAQSLRLRWKRWMLGTLSLSAGVLVAAIALASRALIAVAALALVAGYLAVFAKSHSTAKAWARSAPPEPTPEPTLEVGSATATPVLLPYVALTIGLVAGLIAIGYTVAHLDQLPERLPLRFGLSGRPEAFGPRSFATLWVLPLVTLLLGALLGVHSVLVAHTGRAPSREGSVRTPATRQPFRTDRAKMVAVLTILIAAAMAQLSVSAVRVGLGQQPRLSMSFLLVAAIAAVAGLFQLARRSGQGRAPLEDPTPAPITGSLADNRRWVFGMFYVNRDDPAWLIENRFGYGYTVNVGNPRAVALVVGGAVLAIALVIALLHA